MNRNTIARAVLAAIAALLLAWTGDARAQTSVEPAHPSRGVVWGVVTEEGSGEPVLDATVIVVGTPHKATTDVDGRYRLELPPGTYELRVWYELHEARRVQNVHVSAGQVARVDVALRADRAAEDVVEVEAAPDRGSAAAQLVVRKNAAAVSDAVSAQEIARTPDRNAAEAARRVVGATVVGGRYVYVRGLGERYTNALLNGAPLPSAEPDRQAVPLDLFPAVLLSDVTVAKTFTPDMPGDFAGGSVRIGTRELPETLLLQGTLTAGFNTQTTFAERLSYRGSSLDWLGIDAGARALPESIPDYKVVRLGPKPGGGTISREEITAHGRAINAYMSTTRTVSPPSGSGSVVIGDTFRLGGDARLGVSGALTYGRKFSRRADQILRTFAPDALEPGGPPRMLNDYRAETGLDQVGWGGLLATTYVPARDHRLMLAGLHSRSSENEAREIRGDNEERAAAIRDTRLRFTTRSLSLVQVAGEHVVRPLGGGTLAWDASVSLATSDEPDTRENVYVRDEGSGVYSWDRGTLSGSHTFLDQEESQYGGGLGWTQPITDDRDAPSLLRGGVLLSFRERSFEARRFRFMPRQGVDPAVFREPPDRLFSSENIGTALELEETTQDTDAYAAEHRIVAGYLMADARPWRRLRIVTGGRLEVSSQTIEAFDPVVPDAPSERGELTTADFLPSLSVTFATTASSNLRLSLSRTVARPQLRELAPVAYTDYFGAREELGNPDLRRTAIYNADLRFEVFPGPGEVLAVSAFYKHFLDPIETIIVPVGRGVVSYANADSARNAGVEIEAKKSLGFLAKAVEPLSVFVNATFVHSRVEIGRGGEGGVQTNDERPLAGQSPFVVNAGLDWSHPGTGTRVTLLYNVFGRRIDEVGAKDLPDTYEQPRHVLDLTAAQRIGRHVDVKATVENLLDATVLFTVGEEADEDRAVDRYTLGRTFTLGVTVSY